MARGYRSTAVRNSYQGGEAVAAASFGAHERAAALYSELLAAGHTPDRRVLRSMFSIADRIGCAKSARHLCGELETLGGVDIALDFTVDHGMRHLHLTCHFTALNDTQDGVLPRLRLNAAVDFTFDIEMPGKRNVAPDSGSG